MIQMTSLLHSSQEGFTLTAKELVSPNNREKNLTELETAATLESSSFPTSHALLGLLSLGCVALQIIMGDI